MLQCRMKSCGANTMTRKISLSQFLIGMTLMITAIASGVILAGWVFLQQEPKNDTVIQGFHAIDRSNDRELVGFADSVYFGVVVERIGQFYDRGGFHTIPETQFEVLVLETLKGSVSGEIVVNQTGGTRRNGSTIRMADDPDLLNIGTVYLFASRFSEQHKSHFLIDGYGNIPVKVPDDLAIASDSASAIIASPHAAQLRTRFTGAIANEIPFGD